MDNLWGNQLADAMTVAPFFKLETTRAAYQLRFHLGWYSQGRQPTFADADVQAVLRDHRHHVAEEQGYHILEMDIEPRVVRALLSLTPPTSPSDVTGYIKGTLATAVRNQLGHRNLWSKGWFVRSVGAVTDDVIRKYVAEQFSHHGANVPGVKLASFSPGNPAALRTASHSAFEYNLHVVLVVRRQFDFLDVQVGESLVDYVRRVCDKKQWIPWEVSVVSDHMHLFLGVRPTDSPQDVALSLMNNTAFFLHERYGAALRDEDLAGVWVPGYYVGTVGAATTAQVKAYLRSQPGRGEGSTGTSPVASENQDRTADLGRW